MMPKKKAVKGVASEKAVSQQEAVKVQLGWLERQRRRIVEWNGPVLFVGSADWGAASIIRNLASRQETIWVRLSNDYFDDLPTQSRLLAESVNRVLGAKVLPLDAPLESLLQMLRQHLSLLGRYTLVLWGAELGHPLAEGLLSLSDAHRVVLVYGRKKNEPKDGQLVLTAQDLRLSEADALGIAAGRLPQDKIKQLWELSGGALEPFLSGLHQALKLPPPSTGEPEEGFPAALEQLLDQKHHLEALAWACQHSPSVVPQLLEWLERYSNTWALLGAAHEHLAHLPWSLRRQESVLRWRLEAALERSVPADLAAEAEAYLAQHEAPELRALYAEYRSSMGDPEGYLHHAEQAVRLLRSPRTLYAYGRALAIRSPEQGRAGLLEAASEAEHAGNWYWAAVIAEALSERLNELGDYRGAAYWAEWGLRTAEREHIVHPTLCNRLLNEWAFSRLLIGEIEGVEERLRQALEAGPTHALGRLLQSTLADLLLAQGRTEEAQVLYEELWNTRQQRVMVGRLASLLVRVLLEVGQSDRALELAREALKLTHETTLLQKRRAHLSYGMVLAFRSPNEAIPILEKSMREFEEPMYAWRYAQAALHLTLAHLTLGQVPQAQATLRLAEPALSQLGPLGLRYLAGPEGRFREVLDLMHGEVRPILDLRVLGQNQVRLNGQPLRLGLRATEILVVLALNPTGLSLEQLALALYGDQADQNSTKVHLSGLRKQVPILNRPYRLEAEVKADFIQVLEEANKGDLREAVALYRGELLPISESPVIVEYREYLSEAIRQVVMQSGNLEAILDLVTVEPDDIELWEVAHRSMPADDPRFAMVKTRYEYLERSWYE
jgi:hypothetical protein